MNLQRWNLHWQMQINMIRIQMMEEMIILVGMMNLTGTPVSRRQMPSKYQKSKIASLKLDLQESDIKISQLEKKAK